jgi:hypothetical protein
MSAVKVLLASLVAALTAGVVLANGGSLSMNLNPNANPLRRGTTVTASGQLRDGHGRPVANAVIVGFVRQENGPERQYGPVRTDSQGRYTIHLPMPSVGRTVQIAVLSGGQAVVVRTAVLRNLH